MRFTVELFYVVKPVYIEKRETEMADYAYGPFSTWQEAHDKMIEHQYSHDKYRVVSHLIGMVGTV